MTWQDLWFTRDQQGQYAFNQGHAEQAKKLFHDPEWKAVAAYRAKDFAEVIKQLEHIETPLAQYNLGNAYAQTGDFQKAIMSYDKALKLDPHFSDAKYNKDLLEQILKNQAKQPQNQNNNSKQTSSNQQKQDHQMNSSGQLNPKQQSQTSHTSPPSMASNPKQQASEHQNSASSKNVSPLPNKPKQELSSIPKAMPSHTKTTESTQAINKQSEQQLKQWLQQVPDDPGGLLRNKFLREHLKQQFSDVKEDQQ